MKYCRFQFNGQAQYGLVESVGGRDAIVRVLLTAPEEADGDMESLRTRRIEAIPLEEASLLPRCGRQKSSAWGGTIASTPPNWGTMCRPNH